MNHQMHILHTYKIHFSKGIFYLYAFISILMLFIFGGVITMVAKEDANGLPFILIIIALILSLLLYISYRSVKTRFHITDDSLIIKGIFSTHTVPRSNISSIVRSPVPFGFRLFGASLLGGLYYMPGIGFTWVAMGNFKDGVLIKTNQKNFFITPENPEEFINNVSN